MKERIEPAAENPPALFIGKWTVKVLHLLQEQPHRHGQLRRRLGTVSQRMLTRTLRNLEATGLISRRVTRSRSIAVEYALTRLGRTFLGPLNSICRWSDRHGRGVNAVINLSAGEGAGRGSPRG